MERQESGLFPTYNKEDWYQSFLKEVGPESFDSMQFEVDGQVFLPYYTAEDLDGTGGKLPKYYEQIRFGQIFDLRKGKLPLKDIQASLQHGYDAPVFLCDEITMADRLQDIHMDYINARFELDNAAAEDFITELAKQYRERPWKAEVVRNYINPGTIDAVEKHVIEFDAGQSVLEFLPEFKERLDQLEIVDPSSVIVKIKLTGQLVKDIVKSRAVKIFWFNYLASKSIPLKPYLCEISWDLPGDYPNEVLFHTNNIIAATMAQADQIMLDPDQDDEDRNRILRNSVHIALIESHLGDDPDPVAGSYFIEYVANALAEKAWSAG